MFIPLCFDTFEIKIHRFLRDVQISTPLSIFKVVFLNQNFTGNIFVDLVENTIKPLIVQVFEDQIDGEPQFDETYLHFQLDRAPPQFALQTRQWLD